MIVVLGSINVDLLLNVTRLPVRGETVLCPSYDIQPGGKGANQAAAAARCGSEVRMIGCVGRDLHAGPALDTLQAFGVDLAAIARVDTVTGTAAVMIEDGGENQIVVASGANMAVRADQIPADALDPATILLLQMEIPVAEIEKAIMLGRKAGSRIILNLAPALAVDEAILRQCDGLIVNETEAGSLADNRDAVEQASDLARRFDLDCIVTLGNSGAVLATAGASYRIGALPVEAIDAVGAGDAFVGAFAAMLDRGATATDALRAASVAGGLACTRAGAQIGLPSLREIEDALPGLAPAARLS